MLFLWPSSHCFRVGAKIRTDEISLERERGLTEIGPAGVICSDELSLAGSECFLLFHKRNPEKVITIRCPFL